MVVTPRIEERPSVRYLALRDKVHRDHLNVVVPRAIAEVAEALQQLLVTRSGPPFVRILAIDDNTGEVDVHVGFPVEIAAAPAHMDRLRIGDLPAGRYAVVMHPGPHDTLADTTRALFDWAAGARISWARIDDGRITHWVGRTEQFIVGPPSETRSAEWRTEVAVLMR